MSSEYLYWQAKCEAASCERDAFLAMLRPSMMLKPALSRDGDQWCALYGGNLAEGVAGFGDSPEDAYADFDEHWRASLPESLAANKAD